MECTKVLNIGASERTTWKETVHIDNEMSLSCGHKHKQSNKEKYLAVWAGLLEDSARQKTQTHY